MRRSHVPKLGFIAGITPLCSLNARTFKSMDIPLLQAEKQIRPIRVIKPKNVFSWTENDDFLNPRTPPLPPCVDHGTAPRYALRGEKHARGEVEGRRYLSWSLARRCYRDAKAVLVFLKNKAIHLAAQLKAPKHIPPQPCKDDTGYASDTS